MILTHRSWILFIHINFFSIFITKKRTDLASYGGPWYSWILTTIYIAENCIKNCWVIWKFSVNRHVKRILYPATSIYLNSFRIRNNWPKVWIHFGHTPLKQFSGKLVFIICFWHLYISVCKCIYILEEIWK